MNHLKSGRKETTDGSFEDNSRDFRPEDFKKSQNYSDGRANACSSSRKEYFNLELKSNPSIV
jgi:hypothetical protein